MQPTLLKGSANEWKQRYYTQTFPIPIIIYSIQAHIKEYLLTNTKDCQIEQRSKETPLLTLNLLNVKEFKKKKAIDFAKKGK